MLYLILGALGLLCSLVVAATLFWAATTKVFSVQINTGIWWFALIFQIALMIFLYFTVMYRRLSWYIKLLYAAIFISLSVTLVVLGFRHKPFDPSNIEFKLGSLLTGADDLDTVNYSDLPEAKDTVSYEQFLPPVVDQGVCNGCWAVSAAGCLSARLNIKTNTTSATVKNTCIGNDASLWHFSPQAIIERDKVTFNGTGKCNSSSYTNGFRYALFGIPSMECVPYFSSKEPNCNTSCGSPISYVNRGDGRIKQCINGGSDSFIWNFCAVGSTSPVFKTISSRSVYRISPNEETIKREISANGPVVCTINFYIKRNGRYPAWTLSSATSSTFISPAYIARPGEDGDEYTKEFKAGGHNLIIYGYGERADGVKYWACRNSWGPNWGASGTIKIERGVDAWNIETYCVTGKV